MSNPPFTVDTGLYYPLANPFSFNHGDEYDFDSTFSPEMNRYLKSPTPATGEADSEANAAQQQQVSDQYQSPTAINMGTLTLQSPTGASHPTQPIPITQGHPPPQLIYAQPGLASSYPDMAQRHIYYHPYNRPENHLRSPPRATSMQTTPPGSSHSATSAPLSSALVSPMSDPTGMSPLHLPHIAGHQYAVAPYAGPGGPESEPRGLLTSYTGPPMGLGLGGPGTGIGVGGTGFHYVSAAQIPQYPPEHHGRVKGGRGRGSMSKQVKRTKTDTMDREDLIRVKGEREMHREGEEEDDAEGESVLGDNIGTHKSQLEKRRRSVLKDHFATLAGLLPINGSGKGTKAGILDRATSYIQELRMSLNSVTAQHEEVKRALADERRAHIETQRLNAELSRALATVRTGSTSGSGSPSSWPVSQRM